MDPWIAALLSFSLCVALAALLRGRKRRLPPGPPAFPVVGNLMWLTRPVSESESALRELWRRYGPIVTVHLGSAPSIMVADRDLAHEMLFQHGAVFADRPNMSEGIRLLTSNQGTIATGVYGAQWRILRRNLTSEFLHASRIRQYAESREWVLRILLDDLRCRARVGDGTVVVVESFQYAMFCLLVLLCFGEKLDEEAVRRIERVQRDLLLFISEFDVLTLASKIAMYAFTGSWNRLLELRQRRRELFVPLIRARRRLKEGISPGENSFHFSYVDSLLDLELPGKDGGKLSDEEIMGLCSEFLNAGNHTTSTALQWIMANVVKHPRVQESIVKEISALLGEGAEQVKEDDLQGLPYLKAVVLEGLRRHPPLHFVLPHAATAEVSLRGYVIPKGVAINFAVAEMNLDGRVWEEPLAFRPERFLAGGEGEGVDVTGSKQIKMMTFGAGRRICPGMWLALLHLEFFVANLVREFEWKAVEGGEAVDLSEKAQFTVVMRNPLRARIFPRGKIDKRVD